MSRYIDEELIKFNECYLKRIGGKTVGFASETEVNKIPTADVQEVKHGHWNIEKIGVKKYKGTCSVCGLYYEDEPRQILTFSDMEYCPRCGAKMDEEIE